MLPQASPRVGGVGPGANGHHHQQQQQQQIVNKPARGWLHPDHLFAQDGINYAVRYIGCLEVNTSMKVLDFDTRSAIAKECINRVCESAGVKSADKRRRPDKKVTSMLGEQTKMDRAGANVHLTITSLWLKLSDMDTGQAIFVHDMPNISFASGGDSDTLDFVAYVAKDRSGVRSCYVLECGGGLAQDVITTVGQAFELRFKEFLRRTPGGGGGGRPPPLQISNATAAGPPPTRGAVSSGRRPDHEVEYYNDLPGKRPPPLPSPKFHQQDARAKKDSTSSNLIDFSTDLPHPASVSAAAAHQQPSPLGINPPSFFSAGQHEYVNGAVTVDRASNRVGGGANNRDPFDMSPFATAPPDGGGASLLQSSTATSPQDAVKARLLRECWFHGPISRRDAESLLQLDGDFLVRESQGSEGQYVLTGMQGGSKKHLLLVDPEGVVRTKDRTFESVSHLIDYHRDNNLPIISVESALRLKRPVPPPTMR